MITFKQFLDEAGKMTAGRAETKFMFGDCGAFAFALQQERGGEVYVLNRNDKPMHAYLRVGDDKYDVKGKRNTGQMALGITGSLEGWKVTGPYTQENLPLPVKPKAIEVAKQYIADNPKVFA